MEGTRLGHVCSTSHRLTDSWVPRTPTWSWQGTRVLFGSLGLSQCRGCGAATGPEGSAIFSTLSVKLSNQECQIRRGARVVREPNPCSSSPHIPYLCEVVDLMENYRVEEKISTEFSIEQIAILIIIHKA